MNWLDELKWAPIRMWDNVPIPENHPDYLEQLCDICGELEHTGNCDTADPESDPATWTIPGDGFADGGTPYREEPS